MNKTFQDLLDSFVDKLIQEQGADRLLSEDALKEFRDDLLKNIINRINISIVESIPEEKLEEYQSVLSKSKEEQTDFLKKTLPNLDQIIAQELIEFRKLYVK